MFTVFTRKSQLAADGVTTYGGLTQSFAITLNVRGYSLFENAIFNESDRRIKENIEDVAMIIINAIHITDTQSRGENRSLKIVDDYYVDNVSEKISRIILGNIDLVRQDVWREG